MLLKLYYVIQVGSLLSYAGACKVLHLIFIAMSKDKTKVGCYTIKVNNVPFINVENIENAVSMALGLHKMSNLKHVVVVTDPSNTPIVILNINE